MSWRENQGAPAHKNSGEVACFSDTEIDYSPASQPRNKSNRDSSPFQVKIFKSSLSPKTAQLKKGSRLVTAMSDVKLNFQLVAGGQNNKFFLPEGNKASWAVSYEEGGVLEQIKKEFGGRVYYDKLKGKYVYSSGESYGSAKKLIKYFDRFHLQSGKHVAYIKWRKAYRLVQDKKWDGLYKYIKSLTHIRWINNYGFIILPFKK